MGGSRKVEEVTKDKGYFEIDESNQKRAGLDRLGVPANGLRSLYSSLGEAQHISQAHKAVT